MNFNTFFVSQKLHKKGVCYRECVSFFFFNLHELFIKIIQVTISEYNMKTLKLIQKIKLMEVEK